MSKKSIKALSIRLDEELYEKIKKEANRTENSMNKTINNMLFIIAYQMKLN